MSSGESVRPSRHGRRRFAVVAAAALLVSFAPAIGVDASPSHRGVVRHSDDRTDKLLFFASDGLRQDAVEQYAKKGVVPGFRDLLKNGAKASDNGLLTQSPPNTGAGWFTLATGAWPGVHGSTNNTFHVNGQPFGNSTSALGTPGVLQAETLAQATERGGKKVAQIEWAGGRSGSLRADARLPQLPFRSRCRDQLHHPPRFSDIHSRVRSAIRPPRRVRRSGRVPAGHAHRRRPAGPMCRSPTARRWRCACG